MVITLLLYLTFLLVMGNPAEFHINNDYF